MKVVVYVPDYNRKHEYILRCLAEGIPGALVRPVTQYEPCDVAVIFGGVKKAFKPTWSKQDILDRHSERSLLMVESAFIRRGTYYQVGWGGTAGNADFCTNADTPLDRFEALNALHRNWKIRKNGPIVVCGQLIRDTQVQDMDHPRWCQEVVHHYHDKGHEVLFRPHPKADSLEEYGVPERFLDTNEKLKHTMMKARALVTWNSTSGVDAGVFGCPVVALDSSSMAYEIAGNSLNALDKTPDRTRWLAKLGYSQWTLDEMVKGLPWKWLTRDM